MEKVSRQSLNYTPKANEKRNYKIFEEFAKHLRGISQQKNSNDTFDIKGNIYTFDSSTVDRCLSVFCWAHFRKTKAGIKLHTLFDINTQIPVFVYITKASIHDVNAMNVIDYEPLAYYIFDSAYVDFTPLKIIIKN